MLIYLAGGDLIRYGLDVSQAPNVNRMFSYQYMNTYNKEKALPFKNVIMDSGIFTFLNSSSVDASKVDWDEYIHNYAEFIRTNQIKNYVENAWCEET